MICFKVYHPFNRTVLNYTSLGFYSFHISGLHHTLSILLSMCPVTVPVSDPSDMETKMKRQLSLIDRINLDFLAETWVTGYF